MNLPNSTLCEFLIECDCDGNINVQVGDEAFGGIVFYYDSIGDYGLVAAVEDLTEGAYDIWNNGFSGYEWGYTGGV